MKCALTKLLIYVIFQKKEEKDGRQDPSTKGIYNCQQHLYL